MLPFGLSIPSTLDEAQAIGPTNWQALLRAEPASAAAWMEAAAALGHREAQLVMGQWRLDGHGAARDPAQALAWFIKAARQGEPMGMNMAGRCCEVGWGTPVNAQTAAHWYQQAAVKGLPQAMYNLANLLASGIGVPQDHAAALTLYRNAADLGYAKAKTKIGRYYEDGLLVEKDLEAAFFCYQEGAEGGDFRGQFCYAGMLAERGRLEEAAEWLRKVPLTATPAYKEEAGRLLMRSSHPVFHEIGKDMLAQVGNR